MFVSKRPTTNGYRAELLFNEGTDTFLSVTATLQHKLDEKSLGQAAISFVTGGLIYTVSLDATQVSPEALANRPASVGSGKVRIRVNDQVTDGAFDFSAWKPSGLDRAPGIEKVLPQPVKSKIEPFGGALNTAVKHDQEKSGGAFSTQVGQPPPAQAWRGKACRAACWGVCGGVGALCCLGGAGFGCVLGAVAGGALASLCSDSCPA